MSDPIDRDLYVDEALGELCDAVLEADGVAPSDEARRPLLEILGRLPYALAEVEPAPSVKESLLAEVLRSDTPRRAPVAPRREPVAPRLETQSPDPVRSLADHRARRSQSASPAAKTALPPARSARWLQAAAVLLLALGAFAILQSNRVRDQRQTLARLEVQVAAVQQKVEALELDRDQARRQLARVSRAGTEVCALRPRHANAPRDAHGTLYVMPDGEGWVLSLNGLKDVPGKAYQLWFVGDDSITSEGTFATGNRPYALARVQSPPPDTRAIMITLEAAGGAPRPTGPEMLFGAAEDMISFL